MGWFLYDNGLRHERVNHRLSRVRRIIENTFGILVARWRVLQSPIDATPEKTEKIVLACIVVRNYLRQTDSARYTPSGFIDSDDSTGTIKNGLWREEPTIVLFKILESLGLESIRVLLLMQERLWQNILFLKKLLCHGS